MDSETLRVADQQRPFVGRDAELGALRGHLGHGRLVLVSGDPGIGKTRLVEELAAEARARRIQVRWGRCWEGDGAPAFWPWIEIVRGLVRHADTETLRTQLGSAASEIAQLVADVRARLPDVPEPPRLDPKQSRFRLFDGIATFLAHIAATQPLVLILEDLHWADAPSLLLLQFLAREIESVPLLLIGTLRDVEVDRTHPLADTVVELRRNRGYEELALEGLSAHDVHRYVELVAGHDTAERVAASLHRDTDGNPFFLGEIVRLLAREAPTGGAREARVFVVPDTVRDVIARRLRAYSTSSIEVLRVASVVGQTFTVALLQRLPDLDGLPLLDLLGEAIAGRLITESPGGGGEHRFTHALIRETLYDDLPMPRRVQLHRRVGEALEAHHGRHVDAHAAELAHHFLHAAAEGEADRAIGYAVRAGKHATELLAHEEAVEHYTRALRAVELWRPSDEERATTVLIALGRARIRAGEPAAAEDAFLRAAALARKIGAHELLAEAALGLGEIERFHDRLGPLLEEALDRLGPTDSILRVRVLTRLIVTLYWAQPTSRKMALSDEAVAMARRLGHASTLAYALAGRITALSGPDDVEARLSAATEMHQVADACGDRELAMVGRGWSIADSLALGHIDRVRAQIEAFVASAAELRHPYYMWWAGGIRTMQAILGGRLAEAETLAQEALMLGQRAVVADATQVFAGHLYVLHMEDERLDQLEMVMQALVQQFPTLAGARCGIALLYAERGRAADAEAEMAAIAADGFVALPKNPEWLGCVAVLAEASALLPGAPYADVLYDLLLPYRHRVIVSGMGVLCAGTVSHFLGMLATRLGRWDEAEALFEDTLRILDRIGAVASTAYSQCEYARLAFLRGDTARGVALRDTALHSAERLGMKRLRRRILGLDENATASARSSERPSGTLRREGDYWMVRWQGSEFRLRDSVGLHYLATLLANPAREYLAIDLVTNRRGHARRPAPASRHPSAVTAPADDAGDAGPHLDRDAKVAYRRRLDTLRADLAEAEAFGDRDRADSVRREIDALAAELTRAVGLGGRDRRAASQIERARVSATRAIRSAVQRIRENDPALGRHLAVAIKTGTFCSYAPSSDAVVSWTL